MKLVHKSLLSFVLLFSVGSAVAADEDQKPLPKLDAVLAAIQARAAKQVAENRLKDQSNELEGLKPIQSFHIRANGSLPMTRSLSGGDNQGIREIMGCLKIDGDHDDVPQFRIYYEGMETVNNDEGFFKFPVDQGSIDKYSLIICNKIQHTFGRNNTVDSFGLIPDMNYKLFRFDRKKDGSSGWVQQERNLNKKKLRVPKNAVVVTVNPAYFDRLELEWPGKAAPHMLKLPRIVFKANHREKLERKAIKSLLHGLDMSPFHTNVKQVSKEIGDGKGEVLVPFAK